jgi:predicted nucleotidyltransferase
MLKKAERAAAIISAFPFVRSVAVSGSLSKYFADEKSDIDFFIITRANRLWIARTLLHVFKKLTFIVGRQGYFCMNYFIDEKDPSIAEKNIYTAMEVATVLPLRDNGLFDQFLKANSWVSVFFPNKYLHTPPVKKTVRSWIKSPTEKLLNNKFGDSLDNFLMKQTAKNWNAKTKSNKTDNKGMLMSMHVSRHFSKPNPEVFQKKILQSYENSLSEIFKRCELSVAK